MKLREKSHEIKISEIKKDILKLQKELDDLYSEHNIQISASGFSSSPGDSDNTSSGISPEDLKRSEKLYRQLVESANSIIIRWDMNGTLLYANEYALRFFGYSYSEMIGSDVRMLIPLTENSGRILSNLVEDIISSPENYLQFENENIRKNGEHVWVNWANRVITDEQGDFSEILAIGNDISGIKRTEEKLARERELFEGIFNNIPVMITIYDPMLQNFRFNTELKRLTGWTEDDAADGNFIEKVYPDPVYRQEVVEYMQSLESGWKEWEMTTKSGTKLMSSWANILLENGVQIGIGIDIRERKQAEATLKENEQRLRATFNNAAIGIVEVDPQDMFINANNRICEMLEFEKSELLGKNVHDITAPEDRSESDVINDKIHKGEVKVHDYEKRYIKRDGSAIWVHVTVSGVYDSSGKHLNSIGTIEDISERKKTEQALRESEERLRLLADNISQMVWISDPAGMPVWFNKRWYDYTGINLDQMQNGGHLLVNHPDQSSHIFDNYLNSVQNGNVWEETYQMRSKTGEYRWFLTRMVPVFDNKGKITMWFGTSTDIDEKIQSEESLRKNEQRLKGIFDNAAIGIVELDNQNRFIMVNDRVCEILGYTTEELLNKSILEITASEDREHTKYLYETVSKGETNILNYEKRYSKKDGNLLWVHISISAIRNERGEYIRSIGTVKDISERKNTEEKLKETLKIAEQGKNILTALMKYVPMGITIADAPDVTIRMISKYGEELTGMPAEESLGIPAPEHAAKWKVYHMDGVTPAQTHELPLYRSVKSGEVIKNEEWFIIINNGTMVPILCQSAPIRNIDGNITGAVMGWQDITERRRIMEELQKSEERYRTVIEAADLGTWDFDIETGVAIHSLRHDQIFGYTEPQPVWSYEISVKHILPEYHKTVRDAVARAIETGMLEYDAKIVWPDGSVRWIGPRGRVKYSAEGKPLRMSGIVADITDRKNAEEAVKESEEKFRSLFENITEGVALYEIDEEAEQQAEIRVIDANPAFKESTSPNSELDALNLFENSENTNRQNFIHVAQTREPLKFEANLSTLNRYFVVNVISPKKGQFATVLEDITEQKRVEQELKQKNDELTRFIYTVSHDLKSPLVTIKSFTSFLKEDIAANDTEAQNKDITFIQNAVDRMGKLLDELLELSRIGRKEIPKTYVSLKEIVRSAMEMVAGRLSQKNVLVSFTGPSVMLYGHSERLIQLYQNLLDNAAKFTGNQPQPQVEIGSFTDKDNQVVLFVRDNGLGIDPKYHHKIFGLFEKLDVSTEGTGIGLALIKRIVEVHGGVIWFHSEGIGKGTTFFFTLEKTRLSSEGEFF